MARHAGAARWAYNHALAVKVGAHEQWKTVVAELVSAGMEEAAARRQVRVSVPTKPVIQKALDAVKGDSCSGADGVCPWWHEVSTYALQSAFADADQAWSNWLSSLKGERPGRAAVVSAAPRCEAADDPARHVPSAPAASDRRGPTPRVSQAPRPAGHDGGTRPRVGALVTSAQEGPLILRGVGDDVAAQITWTYTDVTAVLAAVAGLLSRL